MSAKHKTKTSRRIKKKRGLFIAEGFFKNTQVEEFDSAKLAFKRILLEQKKFQKEHAHCVAVFDLDETILRRVDDTKRTFPNIRNLIDTLKSNGAEIFFITARRESTRHETTRTLLKMGLVGKLIMRPNDGGRSSIVKAEQRRKISNLYGCSLFLNVGDQLSDIAPATAWRVVSNTFARLPEKSFVGKAVRHAASIHDEHYNRLKHTFKKLDRPFILWGGHGGDIVDNVFLSLKLPNTAFFTH